MRFPPSEGGLDLVTHFYQTEYGKSDGLSRLRLGYQKTLASVLGAVSLALSNGGQLLSFELLYVEAQVSGC